MERLKISKVYQSLIFLAILSLKDGCDDSMMEGYDNTHQTPYMNQNAPPLIFIGARIDCNDGFYCFLRTLNGCLLMKHGAVWPQTLSKRISDDSRHFIFQLRTKFLGGVEKRNVRNRLKCVLTKFRADQSQV